MLIILLPTMCLLSWLVCHILFPIFCVYLAERNCEMRFKMKYTYDSDMRTALTTLRITYLHTFAIFKFLLPTVTGLSDFVTSLTGFLPVNFFSLPTSFLIRYLAAVVVHWVRAFVSRAEGWLFKSQAPQTQDVKTGSDSSTAKR